MLFGPRGPLGHFRASLKSFTHPGWKEIYIDIHRHSSNNISGHEQIVRRWHCLACPAEIGALVSFQRPRTPSRSRPHRLATAPQSELLSQSEHLAPACELRCASSGVCKLQCASSKQPLGNSSKASQLDPRASSSLATRAAQLPFHAAWLRLFWFLQQWCGSSLRGPNSTLEVKKKSATDDLVPPPLHWHQPKCVIIAPLLISFIHMSLDLKSLHVKTVSGSSKLI